MPIIHCMQALENHLSILNLNRHSASNANPYLINQLLFMHWEHYTQGLDGSEQDINE
jgi:hypothetical protein